MSAAERTEKSQGPEPLGLRSLVNPVTRRAYALGAAGSPIGVVGSACASLRNSSKRTVLR